MENNIIWETFPLNTRYQVSTCGKIRSPHGRLLKPSQGKVWLYEEKVPHEKQKNKLWQYHHIIAITFIPNPQELPEVKFKDGNRQNCKAWNLEWVTHKSNLQMRPRNTKRGELSPIYGRRASKETKSLMAAAKSGENHPKFKGHYCNGEKRYTSAKCAQDETGINQRNILRWSAAEKHGWSFMPVSKNTPPPKFIPEHPETLDQRCKDFMDGKISRLVVDKINPEHINQGKGLLNHIKENGSPKEWKTKFTEDEARDVLNAFIREESDNVYIKITEYKRTPITEEEFRKEYPHEFNPSPGICQCTQEPCWSVGGKRVSYGLPAPDNR